MSRPHYLVFVQGGHTPKHKHGTLAEAKVEAERLADKSGRVAWLPMSLGVATPRPEPARASSGETAFEDTEGVGG